LIPCTCGGDECGAEHAYGCPALYRPAVAAALAEAHKQHCACIFRNGAMVESCKYHGGVLADIAQLRAEFIALERSAIAETQECNQLRAQIAEMHERSDARDAAIEREGYVRGLERAIEMAHQEGCFHGTAAITAEIEKASKP